MRFSGRRSGAPFGRLPRFAWALLWRRSRAAPVRASLVRRSCAVYAPVRRRSRASGGAARAPLWPPLGRRCRRCSGAAAWVPLLGRRPGVSRSRHQLSSTSEPCEAKSMQFPPPETPGPCCLPLVLRDLCGARTPDAPKATTTARTRMCRASRLRAAETLQSWGSVALAKHTHTFGGYAAIRCCPGQGSSTVPQCSFCDWLGPRRSATPLPTR